MLNLKISLSHPKRDRVAPSGGRFGALIKATITMSDHTLYSPSSLERRALCPGSARMEAGLQDESSEAADRGSKLHGLVAAMIKGEAVSDIADVPQTDIDACLAIAEVVKGRIVAMNNPLIFIEVRRNMTYHEGEKGTPDIVLVEPFGQAYIGDYKFGSLQVTPANRNLQLLAEAISVAAEFDCNSVMVELFQPALGEPTNHVYQADELRQYETTLKKLVQDCLAPDAPLKPHAKACQFCKARGMCPELKQQANLPVKVEAQALTVSEIGEWLNKLEIVRIFHSALKARAFSILATGGSIPGWKLKESLKDREWTEDAAREIPTLLSALGKAANDAYEPATLKSPAQIEKIIGKSKAVQEVMKRVTKRETGNPQLVRDNGQ